ncbi:MULTISPECIES: hypothetical protein, partial [Rhodonellum]|uniref:hypothetical protein n=1 Tax=Rhodonellum TaxID=336827 RepID=UPI00200B035B
KQGNPICGHLEVCCIKFKNCTILLALTLEYRQNKRPKQILNFQRTKLGERKKKKAHQKLNWKRGKPMKSPTI